LENNFIPLTYLEAAIYDSGFFFNYFIMKKQFLLLFLVSNLLLSAQINDLSIVTNFETFKLNDTNTINTYGVKLRLGAEAFGLSDNITINTSIGYKKGNGISLIKSKRDSRYF
jgi:hypothetical protein